jgi:aminoglycoside phosphotransferase (APT) family kinase protein
MRRSTVPYWTACLVSTVSQSDRMPILEEAIRLALDDAGAIASSPAKLAGGAMHESWAVKALKGDSETDLVVRLAPAGRADIQKMRNEYGVLKAMYERGVTAPEPLAMGSAPTGEVYMVMRRIEGDTNPRRLVTEPGLEEARKRFIDQLAESLAIIHSVRPSEIDGVVLRSPEEGQDAVVHEQQRLLQDYHRLKLNPHPAVVWALRWVEREAPSLKPTGRPILMVHGDLRVGNLMYDDNGLAAILDWEGAHAGEPEEDLAWFCTRVWRFGQNHLEAGGVTDRETWVRAYEKASGTDIDRDRLRVWEVLRNVHWAVVCMMQARAHVDSQQRSHELAAIGRRAGDTELEILRLTGVAQRFADAG